MDEQQSDDSFANMTDSTRLRAYAGKEGAMSRRCHVDQKLIDETIERETRRLLAYQRVELRKGRRAGQ